ncbi:MAG: DUF4013 domain-containing protein [Methanocorpusculum parvum]|nr:DUF4013 domain-containing protein [Methanocorpusculum parvum]
MSIGISENFKQSFAFTKENLLGKIQNWVILFVLAFFTGTFLTELFPNLELLWAVLTIAASVIISGLIVRIYAGGDVTFASFGTVIIKGIGYNVAALVYSLPALILMVIAIVVMLVPILSGSPEAGLTGAAIGLVILMPALILAFLASAFIIPAAVNYAHSTGVGGAFRISEILSRIEKAGWGMFIGSFLIFLVIQMVVAVPTAILTTFGLPIIGGIVTAVINPIILVLRAKYFANRLS